jgi:hypothetical protein
LAPVTEPKSIPVLRAASSGAAPAHDAVSRGTPLPDDGTNTLLRTGSWILLAGVLCLLATLKLFGGIGIYGPHTNAGWLSFMFAMMGIPFSLMLLVLGGAKWLRNRHLRHRAGLR